MESWFFLCQFYREAAADTRKRKPFHRSSTAPFWLWLLVYFVGTNEIQSLYPTLLVFSIYYVYIFGWVFNFLFLRGSFPLLWIAPLESMTKKMNFSYFIAAAAAAALLFWLEVTWPEEEERENISALLIYTRYRMRSVIGCCKSLDSCLYWLATAVAPPSSSSLV